MSSAALRAFDRLLTTKRRRIEQMEAEAEQARQALQQCEQAHAEAAKQEKACRDDEVDCGAKIDALPARDGGFKPADFVTLRHILATLTDHTRKAAKQTEQAARLVEQAQQAVGQVRRRLQRAEQQLEQLKQRRRDMALRLEQAQEDAQDEESEETAVARLVAARIDAEFQAA
jgi:flagellar biosynthesis chaperone FliJ